MITDPVSTAAVDYLQRLGFVPAVGGGTVTAAPLSARRVVRVAGVGRPARTPAPPADGRRPEPPTLPLLIGLAGAGAPVAFLVEGHGQGVTVRLGTWDAAGAGAAGLDERQAMLLAVLNSSYPVVDIAAAGVATPRLGYGAFGLGVPSPAAADPRDGALAVDRLVRSMAGQRWAALVLAAPVGAERLGADRNGVLNEMRAAATAVQATGMRSPLAEHYLALLEARLEAMADAQARGGWRTGVYLLGVAPGDVAALARAWRAVFSGAKSVPEPVRTVPHPGAADLAARWVLPDGPERPGPGGYRHPYAAQTLLSSSQLAAYVHLPELEYPGFSVRLTPAFAVSRPPPPEDRAALDLGTITGPQGHGGSRYRIERDQLTRHAFVAGLTGSGKTNTIMHLLGEAASAGVPFLVIEPAKTEYREMLGWPSVAEKIRVFTVGRESVSPLRLNPFEVPPGIDVSTHLDLLKAVFMGSMALWIPLPQVLEQCLIELYTERGWSFSTGAASTESQSERPDSPALGELVLAVERLVPRLGFKSETTQEITAALTTRLNALRRGGRGLMLDVSQSVPMAELLKAPTIIELEGLGDDADKAFVMGLLLTRLYEHRRAEHARKLAVHARAGRPLPTSSPLSHIVVVEEAHRLLSSARKTTDAWHADPQGAFVDTFSQMLAEVRAYGQAIVVADQVPVRLAPDVLKNTNLKVVHRTVAGDDRDAMAAAMSMTSDQSRELAMLTPGQAAVFSEGDHMPAIVQIPKAKDTRQTQAIDDAAVAAAMASWRAAPAVAAWFRASRGCVKACQDPRLCQAGRRLSETPAARLLAARLFHTAIEHPDGLDAVWPDAEAFAAANTPPHADTRAMLHVLTAHAVADVIARRATQAAWPSQQRAELDHLMSAAISERVAATGRWLGATPVRTALIKAAVQAQQRTHDPFPLCGVICPGSRCAFRYAVLDAGIADLLAVRSSAGTEPAASDADIAANVARQVIEVSPAAPAGAAALDSAQWRALACSAQQLTCANRPREGAQQAAIVITEAGWPMAVPAESQAEN